MVIPTLINMNSGELKYYPFMIRLNKCAGNYSWNSSTCMCENSKHLKIIADTSVTKFDESVIVIDNISTKKTNTIATKKGKYNSNKSYEYCFNKLS